MKNLCRRIISAFVMIVFIFSTILPMPFVYGQGVFNLLSPGVMIQVSPSYTPPIVTGITIHPTEPFKFDFIIGRGEDNLKGEDFQKEAIKLIKYFMTSLTVPDDEMWVNLSPYEKDRIIADDLGDTEMGRDMLVQDYLLKQLTASLMYSDEEIGGGFWDKVYERVEKKFGISEIPMNVFNKIWIVPDIAEVYINGRSVFVVKSHLKVMLEQDYLALEMNKDRTRYRVGDVKEEKLDAMTSVSEKIVRETLIPVIEKEVNEGKTFANLRQIYNSMILAKWYKQNLKDNMFGQLYIDNNKTEGVDIQDKDFKNKIYEQYVESFKKGVFNFIREEYDAKTQEVIPRKYFAGGLKRVSKVKVVGPNEEWGNRNSLIDHAVVSADMTMLVGNSKEKVNKSPDQGWNSATTDPAKHDENNFRYLVHGIVDPSRRGRFNIFELEGNMKGKIGDIMNKIDLFINPEKVHEKLIISTSYIGPKHTDTWSNVGVILNVPSENILSTNTRDIGTPFWEGKEYVIQMLKQRGDLITPEALLSRSSLRVYNEVVITGQNPNDDKKKVNIVGVFLKTISEGEYIASMELVNKAKDIARKLGVPVIEIVNKGLEYIDSEPEAFIYNEYDEGVTYKIAFNRNGKRYFIELDAELIFSSIIFKNKGKVQRSMTSNEFDYFIEIMQVALKGKSVNKELIIAYDNIVGNFNSVEEIRDQVGQNEKNLAMQKKGEMNYNDNSYPDINEVIKKPTIYWNNDGKRFAVGNKEGEITWESLALLDGKVQVNQVQVTKKDKKKLLESVSNYVRKLPINNKKRKELEQRLFWITPDVTGKNMSEVFPDLGLWIKAREILERKPFSPKELLNVIGKDFFEKDVYQEGVGVLEGDNSLWKHTLMALGQFEKYFSGTKLPEGFDDNFFRVFLALHDIGKLMAVKKGNKYDQHKYTVQIKQLGLEGKLPFNRNQLKVVLALMEGDPIGQFMNGEVPLEETVNRITEMAESLSLSVYVFFRLLTIYYQVESGSYTQDSGDINSLDRLFEHDKKIGKFEKNGYRIMFSNKFEEKFVTLENIIKVWAKDTHVGGIDFNPSSLGQKISGEMFQLNLPKLSPDHVQEIKVNGFSPVIIKITPIINFALLLVAID